MPLSGAPVVDRAARAAAEAADGWADVPVMERARLMFRLQALLERDFEELSEIVVRENGKSLDEARGEVRRGIDVVEFAAGMPTLMMGGALEQVSRGVDTELFHHPLGAVAAITPFNFPAMVPLWTSPIAIAAGNSYILKPSPRTPMSAMRLAELFEEAGTPAGVFNVVHGGEEAVNAICDHELIRAVSFVGSAPVAKRGLRSFGRRRQARASARRREEPHRGHARRRSGRSRAGRVLLRLRECRAAVPRRCCRRRRRSGRGRAVGAARRDGTGGAGRPGPRSREHDHTGDERGGAGADRRLHRAGEQEGAQILVDGRREDEGGFFLGPTILDQVRPEMRVAQEEIFGPVLALERLESLDEALDAIAAQRVRQRERDLHTQRSRRTCVPAQGDRRNGRNQRPRARPRWRFSRSRAGKARSTAISTPRAWTACASSPRRRSSRAAGK